MDIVYYILLDWTHFIISSAINYIEIRCAGCVGDEFEYANITNMLGYRRLPN